MMKSLSTTINIGKILHSIVAIILFSFRTILEAIPKTFYGRLLNGILNHSVTMEAEMTMEKASICKKGLMSKKP